MGRYTFFDDFFKTDIMNHVEVLKEMMKLGGEDDRLLVPVLVNLAKQNHILPKLPIIPFYDNHQNFQKNIVRMVEVHRLMQNLRGHNFNIYECCFLDIERASLKITSLFSMITQIMIFLVLVNYNFYHIAVRSEWTDDSLVFMITIATTFFFGKLAFQQYKGAMDFNNVFEKVGCGSKQHKIALRVNIFINGFIGFCVTFFNFFFLIVSSDPNEAILNSLALYFIIELDDTLKPDWDEIRVDDEIGINIHDYIMAGNEDVCVEVISGYFDVQSLIQSEDKVYIQRQADMINVFWRRDSSYYERITFKVSGSCSSAFLSDIDQFYCMTKYKDIHD
tara:strand:- start:16 stop:1017 length:1002 start_codon:yes stop_codon:yes gene_type:complete